MKGNIAAVYCEFKYSGVAHSFPFVAACASLALVAMAPLEPLLRAAAALAIVGLSHRALRLAHAVRTMRIDAARAIEVSFADGTRREGTVCDGSFVAPWLTIVRWREHGAWLDRTVVVLPDMVQASERRRLRVLLHG